MHSVIIFTIGLLPATALPHASDHMFQLSTWADCIIAVTNITATVPGTVFFVPLHGMLPVDVPPNTFGNIIQLDTWGKSRFATVVAPLSSSSVTSPKALGVFGFVVPHMGSNVGGRLDKYHGQFPKHQGKSFDEIASPGSSDAARKEDFIKVVNGSPEEDDKKNTERNVGVQ